MQHATGADRLHPLLLLLVLGMTVFGVAFRACELEQGISFRLLTAQTHSGMARHTARFN